MAKKRVATLVLSIALLLAVTVGGTLAYLTDTDSDVNVMTLGNVDIRQNEQQRIDDANNQHALEAFEQDKPLYPAVYEGDSIPWADSAEWVVKGNEAWKVVEDNANVVDKFVTVENKGISEAYVRTWFAFEVGPNGEADDYIHYVANGANITSGATWEWEWLDKCVVIDNVTYRVGYATYNAALKPGATTIPSLKQVYLDKKADNDVIEALGDEFEILVVSQAVQTAGFDDAAAALKAGFGLEHPFNDIRADVWDGTADTTWYNDTDTEFVITTAEQLAGFAELVDNGNTFEGKTIKLGKDIDLYAKDANGEAICFNPIGSYRNDQEFKGIFDGQDHTISNMSQNTWALNTGYYYGDLGLGLFSAVRDAEIKNLVMDNASISGESGLCGTVAAAAYGDCTFENIKVTNSDVADYQYYAGGIVGWASGDHEYINCDVDASTTVGSQWGDFNNANGGLIGGAGSNGTYYFEDCDVACRIDAHNDVVSAYEWYTYRRSGMLIGDTNHTVDEEAVTKAAAPNVTCKNVTVTYGDWANYHYCQFNAESYPWVRVEAGLSVGAYSNVRYGHPTDANGNEVVDDNHVHNDGEKHHELIVFDQLFGGDTGDRYATYGMPTHDGVTVVYNNK